MAEILKGKPVADKINEQTLKILSNLNHKPTLAIIRIGNNSDDIAYEKAIIKRCTNNSINSQTISLDDNCDKDYYLSIIKNSNDDKNIDGIILLNQLHKEALTLINPKKDIDGCNPLNLSSAFLNEDNSFLPCTAQAVIELLDYYNIEIASKNITVVGRSLTVGKPLSMLLLNRNATVTICHSHSKDIKYYTKTSDIVITAIGNAELFDQSYFIKGQTVIDVGINFQPNKQKVCGDVLFTEVEKIVDKITPVPLGIGSITNAILINHLAKASLRRENEY